MEKKTHNLFKLIKHLKRREIFEVLNKLSAFVLFSPYVLINRLKIGICLNIYVYARTLNI